MVVTQDATKIRVEAWGTAAWNALSMGYFEKPTIENTPEFQDFSIPQTGNIAIGSHFIGMTCKIVIPVMQPTPELLKQMMPHCVSAAGSGAALLVASENIGMDLYDFAQTLVLHPLSAGAAVTSDLTYCKAAPIGALIFDRDGRKRDVVPITFRIFPDRTKLPLIRLGWIGAAPTA